MPDLTITLTAAQARAVAALDANKTVREIAQIHVDTWIAPLLAAIEQRELRLLQDAYAKADDETRTRVREELLAMAQKG
jgi:hypothetical protein